MFLPHQCICGTVSACRNFSEAASYLFQNNPLKTIWCLRIFYSQENVFCKALTVTSFLTISSMNRIICPLCTQFLTKKQILFSELQTSFTGDSHDGQTDGQTHGTVLTAVSHCHPQFWRSPRRGEQQSHSPFAWLSAAALSSLCLLPTVGFVKPNPAACLDLLLGSYLGVRSC